MKITLVYHKIKKHFYFKSDYFANFTIEIICKIPVWSMPTDKFLSGVCQQINSCLEYANRFVVAFTISEIREDQKLYFNGL